MDRRELYPELYSYIQQMIKTALAKTWVADIGILQQYNGDGTAQVQITIKRQSRDQNGDWQDINPTPIIPKAIVLFPGNGQFFLTNPLEQGTEGLLIYCDRCVDAWWQSGGVQSQLDIRQHDATDAIFIPGVFSLPNMFANLNTTSAELRTKSGNTKLAFDDTNGFVLTGNLKVNGTLEVTQAIKGGFGGADQVGLQTHTHPSNGAPPTAGT